MLTRFSPCAAVMILLLLGFLALLAVPAEHQPEGQQHAAAGSAPGAPAHAAAGVLPKPQQPWSALVLGGSGATGRVLMAKLASKLVGAQRGATTKTRSPRATV